MTNSDTYTEDVAQTVSEIDEGYEYLMAYASHAEDTGDDVAEDYVERIREALSALQGIFGDFTAESPDVETYFEWLVTQTQLAIASITLFLEYAETSPDAVNALLSVPPLRSSLTTVLYLEEIGVL